MQTAAEPGRRSDVFIQTHEAIVSRACDLRNSEQFSPELSWLSGRLVLLMALRRNGP